VCVFIGSMFIRKKYQKNKKTGEQYVYHQLIESYQTDKGPRSRILLHLGELNLSDQDLKVLAKLLEYKIKGKPCFLRWTDTLEKLAEQYYLSYQHKVKTISEKKSDNPEKDRDYISIDFKSIEHGFYRSVGAELVGRKFWRLLGFDDILCSLGFSVKERSYAQSVILGRLISPGSERHTLRWISEQSSLSEFFPASVKQISKDSIYQIGDLLYFHKSRIEQNLRNNIKHLYPLPDRVYLYDLTNTYFESSKPDSEICKRGRCKSKRNDCPLVTLALVVDQDGFPVFSKIYRGNQSEPLTLPEVLNEIFDNTEGYVKQLIKPSIVMDRGIATRSNIDYLRTNCFSYFVVERRSRVADYREHFNSQSGFEEHRTSEAEKIYLKKTVAGNVASVLVWSSGKSKKEKSIIQRLEKHFLEDCERLIKSHQKGYIKEESKLHVRIGKLKERYGAIAGKYEFILEKEVQNSSIVSNIKIALTGKESLKSEYPGCYVIETDQTELTAKQIWDFYMKLSEVESAFRSLKSELGTRPVYHQKDARIESHLFISVLAYSILKSITHWLSRLEYNKRWSEIRDILKTHMRSTSIFTSKEGYKYHVRLTGNPEKDAAEIYQLLNINVTPNRKVIKVKE